MNDADREAVLAFLHTREDILHKNINNTLENTRKQILQGAFSCFNEMYESIRADSRREAEQHPSLTPEQVDTVARACHEANRAWCLAHGDASQRSYDEAEEWQRESARKGVSVALSGAGPREQHEAWARDKIADGWTHGPVKDPAAKTHPCLIPYDDLPPEQRTKDSIYIAVVRAFSAAFAETR